MGKDKIRIFLVQPVHVESDYPVFIVYEDSDLEARNSASVAINLMREIKPGSKIPEMDTFYLNEALSVCHEIGVRVIDLSNQIVLIEYLNHEYYLSKGIAERVT